MKIVERASTSAELKFTSLTPADSWVLSTEPVIPVTTKESKTVENITLIARELRTREYIRFISRNRPLLQLYIQLRARSQRFLDVRHHARSLNANAERAHLLDGYQSSDDNPKLH